MEMSINYRVWDPVVVEMKIRRVCRGAAGVAT